MELFTNIPVTSITDCHLVYVEGLARCSLPERFFRLPHFVYVSENPRTELRLCLQPSMFAKVEHNRLSKDAEKFA